MFGNHVPHNPSSNQNANNGQMIVPPGNVPVSLFTVGSDGTQSTNMFNQIDPKLYPYPNQLPFNGFGAPTLSLQIPKAPIMTTALSAFPPTTANSSTLTNQYQYTGTTGKETNRTKRFK